MKKELEDRISRGLDTLSKALNGLEKEGKEPSSKCMVSSLLVLKPDINPDNAKQAMSQEETAPKVLDKIEMKDKIVPCRFTHRQRAHFNEVLENEGVTGIVVAVPASFEGVKGAQKKGVVPTGSEPLHAIAILGRVKEVMPDIYRDSRHFGKEMPKRGVKEKRKRMLSTFNIRREFPFSIEDSRDLLREMGRVAKANALVVLEEGFRYDSTKKKIVHEK